MMFVLVGIWWCAIDAIGVWLWESGCRCLVGHQQGDNDDYVNGECEAA